MTYRHLSLKLAQTPEDLESIQRLRFDVFFTEYGAVAQSEMHALGLDCDEFDPHCQHLMVVDEGAGNKVVATTRLILSDQRVDHLGYIAQAEFDIALLQKFDRGCMEVGRSCVHKDYRDGKAIQLIWQGITKFILDYDIEFLFGCASFHETEPTNIANELSFLHHTHLFEGGQGARALEYISMDLCPPDKVDAKAAMANLPPLIKAYLQIGGKVADGVAFDPDFKTLDILIMVEVAKVPSSYQKYFKKMAGRISLSAMGGVSKDV